MSQHPVEQAYAMEQRAKGEALNLAALLADALSGYGQHFNDYLRGQIKQALARIDGSAK